MPLGDVGRAHPLLRWLEIFLIALVTFHAASSVAIWIVERTQTARHHRIAFGLSLGMAVTVGLLHVVWLFDKP